MVCDLLRGAPKKFLKGGWWLCPTHIPNQTWPLPKGPGPVELPLSDRGVLHHPSEDKRTCEVSWVWRWFQLTNSPVQPAGLARLSNPHGHYIPTCNKDRKSPRPPA